MKEKSGERDGRFQYPYPTFIDLVFGCLEVPSAGMSELFFVVSVTVEIVFNVFWWAGFSYQKI